jgi:hypothetical protein
MGSRKHGVSGHASQSPRFRLGKKLAAERGEYGSRPARLPVRPGFTTVRAAFDAAGKPRIAAPGPAADATSPMLGRATPPPPGPRSRNR